MRNRKTKKTTPETALPEDESSFKGTAVSSVDGAKVLNNLKNLAKEYQESEYEGERRTENGERKTDCRHCRHPPLFSEVHTNKDGITLRGAILYFLGSTLNHPSVLQVLCNP